MSIRKQFVLMPAVALLIATFFAPRAASANDALDIVKHVPANAWGFAIVRSLDVVDSKCQMLAEKIGMPLQVKAMLNNMLPVGDALDTTKPIGIVMLDAMKYQDKGIVLLVPAKDPKALVEALEPGEEKDGIRECKVANETVQTAIKGGLVWVSPAREILAEVLKSEQHAGSDFSSVRAETLQRSDVFVSVALGTVVNAYKAQIMPMVMMAGAAMGGGGPNPFEHMVQMAEQTQSVDIALKIDSNGAAVTVLTSGRKDSDLEKDIGKWKNSSEPLVGWLPKEEFLVAWGSNGGFGDVAEVADVLVALASAGPGGGSEGTKAFAKECAELIGGIGRYAVGVSALPDGPGGMVGLTIALETSDSAKFVKGVRSAYENVWSLWNAEEMELAKKALIHTADAENIDGHKVDTIRLDLKQLGEETSAADVMQFEKICGKSPAVRFGAIDSKHVVVSFGGGESRFKSIAGCVKSGGNALHADAGISAASAQLPGARASEFFLALDTLVRFAKRVATVTGEPDNIPFEVPVLNAPLAGATARQGKIGRMDLFVPMKIVDAGVSISRQMSAGMDNFDEDEDEAEDMEPPAGDSSGDRSE